MTSIGFKEQFAPAVEDGTKRQAILPAECKYDEGICNFSMSQRKDGFTSFGRSHIERDYKKGGRCYLLCPVYTPRIKPGDTLQLYTGLRQRKYCTNAGATEFKDRVNDKLITFCDVMEYQCSNECPYRGAKLLKTATCTESFPIKFEDLTEEIARLDGFTSEKYYDFNVTLKTEIFDSKGDKEVEIEQTKVPMSSLSQLKAFLIKTYNAKDGDVFQIVRW